MGEGGGEQGARLSPEALLAAAHRLLGELVAQTCTADEGRPAVWVVGGALRDELLGLPIRDIDLVVRGPVDRLAARLADELGAAVYPVSERFATYRVVLPGWHVDLAPLRGPTLEDDLRGRDFTVDALARAAEGAAEETAEGAAGK